MTAHRAVFADGPVQGQTLLVTGGAGGVGSTAIQLAVWGGARVLATVSSDEKAEAARAAGAAHTINYRQQDVAAEVKRLTGDVGVDRIVEVDFGGNLAASLQVLKPNGVIASYASRGDDKPAVPFRMLMVKNITVHAILVYTMAESAKEAAMADITRALEQGSLRPLITRRLPLERIAEAHAHVEQVASIGNTVVEV
jgi:NADPH2:quinone reductase